MVKIGQIWADNDKRAKGRHVRVDRIEGDYAFCTIVIDRADTEPDGGRYRERRPHDWIAIGRPTRIKLTRFKPNSTGYRLAS